MVLIQSRRYHVLMRTCWPVHRLKGSYLALLLDSSTRSVRAAALFRTLQLAGCAIYNTRSAGVLELALHRGCANGVRLGGTTCQPSALCLTARLIISLSSVTTVA